MANPCIVTASDRSSEITVQIQKKMYISKVKYLSVRVLTQQSRKLLSLITSFRETSISILIGEGIQNSHHRQHFFQEIMICFYSGNQVWAVPHFQKLCQVLL